MSSEDDLARTEDLRHGLRHDGRHRHDEGPGHRRRRQDEDRMPLWLRRCRNRWHEDAKVVHLNENESQ